MIDLTAIADIDFAGVYTSKADLLQSMSEGAGNAGLVSNGSNQQLYIDVNGDDAIDGTNDMSIVLSGVTELTQDNFVAVA